MRTKSEFYSPGGGRINVARVFVRLGGAQLLYGGRGDGLDELENAHCKFMVLSGSLPPGMPDDFYGQVVAWMRRRNIPLILDSSGPTSRAGSR